MNNIIKETTTSVKEFDKKGRLLKETITVIVEKQDQPQKPPYTYTINYGKETSSDIKYGSATGKI